MTLYQKTLEDFQKGYIGFSTLVVIGQSCLGGAAAMYILKNGVSFFQMFQLGLVVLACSFVNGAILSQQKPKLVLQVLLAIVARLGLGIFQMVPSQLAQQQHLAMHILMKDILTKVTVIEQLR